MNQLDLAKSVLLENAEVTYGIFGIIENSGYFPPLPFLAEFFMGGSDPCDQDGRMPPWRPFSPTEAEYEALKSWWIALHPGTVESTLGAQSWDEWGQQILES